MYKQIPYFDNKNFFIFRPTDRLLFFFFYSKKKYKESEKLFFSN